MQLRYAVKSANGRLYEAIKKAESALERVRISGIVADFSRAGTASNDYVGGGGYIKRAWDETKQPLVHAKSGGRKIPTDMMDASGASATSSKQSAHNWRAHGERLPPVERGRARQGSAAASGAPVIAAANAAKSGGHLMKPDHDRALRFVFET